MDPEEAVVKSEFGPLLMGIRSYKRKYGSFEFESCNLLTFEEDKDKKISRRVLKRNRQMAFQVLCSEKIEGRIYAYLGSLYHRWDNKLAIELKYKGKRGDGFHKWWAEGGSKRRDGKGQEDEDVANIRKNFWCAAEASVYLFLRNKKGIRPIKNKDGNEISTRVSLDYKKDYKDIYEGILQNYSEEGLKGDIGSQFERFAEFKNARKRAEESLGMELYKRLRDVLPKYKTFLGKIIRRPSTHLTESREFYDMGEYQAIRHFENQDPSSTLYRIHKAQKVGGKRTPVRFTQEELTRTPTNKANRYVYSSVNRVRKLIKRVKSHLESEREASGWSLKRHGDAHDTLEKELDRFTRYRRKISSRFGTKVGKRNLKPQNIPEFHFDKRYAKIKLLTDRLDKVLDYVDSSGIPFEIEAFNEIYEKWCFYKVVEALITNGYYIANEEGLERTQFYKNPITGKVNCKMKNEDKPNKVLEIWYEKKYQKLEKNSDYEKSRPYGLESRGPHRSTYDGKKRKPDISLELHECIGSTQVKEKSVPKIVTIDPTLGSPKNNSEKYKYKDALRDFESVNSNGKSKKIVECAWGIWPGIIGDKTWKTSPGPKENKEYGFAHLRAEEKSLKAFPETVKEILVEAGML